MKEKQIKEFLTKAAQNENFKQEFFRFAEKVENKNFSEQDRNKFLANVLLPWSKRLGYGFSYEELLNFDRAQHEDVEYLSTENMQNVSGGIHPIISGTFNAILSAIVAAVQIPQQAAHFIVHPIESYTAAGETQNIDPVKKLVHINRIENGQLSCYFDPRLFSTFYRGIGSPLLSIEKHMDFAWSLAESEISQLSTPVTEEELEYVRYCLESSFLTYMGKDKHNQIRNYFLKKQKQLITDAWEFGKDKLENLIQWELSETENIALIVSPKLISQFGYLMLTAPANTTVSRAYALSNMIINDLTIRYGPNVFKNLGVTNPPQFVFEKLRQKITEAFPYCPLAVQPNVPMYTAAPYYPTNPTDITPFFSPFALGEDAIPTPSAPPLELEEYARPTPSAPPFELEENARPTPSAPPFEPPTAETRCEPVFYKGETSIKCYIEGIPGYFTVRKKADNQSFDIKHSIQMIQPLFYELRDADEEHLVNILNQIWFLVSNATNILSEHDSPSQDKILECFSKVCSVVPEGEILSSKVKTHIDTFIHN